jgi:hypothetical protein
MLQNATTICRTFVVPQSPGLWIRIRKDPELFAGSESKTGLQKSSEKLKSLFR